MTVTKAELEKQLADARRDNAGLLNLLRNLPALVEDTGCTTRASLRNLIAEDEAVGRTVFPAVSIVVEFLASFAEVPDPDEVHEFLTEMIGCSEPPCTMTTDPWSVEIAVMAVKEVKQ